MDNKEMHSLIVAQALFENQIAEASEWKSEWPALVAGSILLVLLVIFTTAHTFTAWVSVCVLVFSGASLLEIENRSIKKYERLIKKLNQNSNY